MQASEYEKGLLVQAAWRLSRGGDVNELFAIACTIRNWVVPRAIHDKRLVFFSSYTAALEEHFFRVYFLRGLPAIKEPALIDPVDGLFVKIDGVYDCTAPDITSYHTNPSGARYFGRAANEFGSGSWFDREVLQQQGAHPLIGTFGSLQFYV